MSMSVRDYHNGASPAQPAQPDRTRTGPAADTRATHLRLLPPPSAERPVDPFSPQALAAVVRRITEAEERGDVSSAAAARADLRATTTAMRERMAQPLDLTPYRTSTPVSSPPPLLIVVEPDRVVFRALVEAEGLSGRRVRRVATLAAAYPLQVDVEFEGREAIIISREGAS